MIALPVNIDEILRYFFQHSRRKGKTVHLDFPAAVRAEFSRDDQLVVFNIERTQDFFQRLDIGDFKNSLNGTRLFAVADQSLIRLRAENEIERIDDNRFSRAGLSRQHVQPFFKIHFRKIHQGDIADDEFLQHITYFMSSLNSLITISASELLLVMINSVSSPAT